MSVFPTFQLPFVAAKAIVNRMDLDDLTILFLCSKKTREFVKTLRKSVSFDSLSIDRKKSLNFLEVIQLFSEEELTLKPLLLQQVKHFSFKLSDDMVFDLIIETGTPEYESESDSLSDSESDFPSLFLFNSGSLHFNVYVECKDQQDQYNGVKRNLEIGDVTIPVVMTKKDVIYTFWSSKQEGFKTIGECLRSESTLFNLDITAARKEEFSPDLRFVINWMNSTNQMFLYANIVDGKEKFNEHDFKFILDKVHPKREYDICVELSDEVQYNTNFESENLSLEYASWFTLENLLKADCKRICIHKSKLTNHDLKEYLKQWMAGKFPKLGNLVVEMGEDLNIDLILSGFEGSPEHIVIIRKNNCIQIKRNGRYVAKISTSGRKPTRFKMETLQF